MLYGTAGSGKTSTLLGGDGRSGLASLCSSALLKRGPVYVSYLEIFNESMSDLVSGYHLRRLRLTVDGVEGLSETKCESTESVLRLVFWM